MNKILTTLFLFLISFCGISQNVFFESFAGVNDLPRLIVADQNNFYTKISATQWQFGTGTVSRGTVLTDDESIIIGACWIPLDYNRMPITSDNISYYNGNFSGALAKRPNSSFPEICYWATSFVQFLTEDVYILRFFATNTFGTYYSNPVTFSTVQTSRVVTIDAQNITSNGAIIGGNIYTQGTVTEKGVDWGYNSNVTNSIFAGTGNDSFSFHFGAEPNTTIFYRAYIVVGGIRYNGAIKSFTTTSGGCDYPIVVTNSASEISQTYATVNGSVTSDGGCNVTDRGVIISKSNQYPTIGGSDCSQYAIGSGIGSFSTIIYGLMSNTMYYVRSYAINSAGTSYGGVVSFITLSSGTQPVLSTNAITSITSSSAISGGIITSDGGSAITSKGVQWSLFSDFSIVLGNTNDGSGSGNFTSYITGLNSITTYYVRAYAINSSGTGYGNQVSFTTSAAAGTLATVSTNPITNITSSSATGGGNVTSDGGSPVTARGVQWSQNSDFSTILGTTSDGSGVGSFSSSITGLTKINDYENTYYVRAYATNNSGTAYGGQQSICYRPLNVSPTLTVYGTNYLINGTSYSISSQADAINVCNLIHTYGYTSGSGLNVESVSFNVGQKLYYRSNNGFDCELINFTGYTVNVDTTNNIFIVYIVNGVIQSITPCP